VFALQTEICNILIRGAEIVGNQAQGQIHLLLRVTPQEVGVQGARTPPLLHGRLHPRSDTSERNCG
jgi:hypothetical protein